MKRIIPLTYEPKIPGVIYGMIRQTLRAGDSWQEGDQIAFHGWSGTPYRSPWSFKTPYYTVIMAEPVILCDEGIWWPSDLLWVWEDQFCDELAKRDGIDPGTGPELKNVLEKYHNPLGYSKFQVIRW